MKKKFSIFTFFAISLIFISSVIQASDLKIYSKGAILIEQDSKRVLFEQNSDEMLPMASTTKIMTCLLALEKGNLEDVVTTSARAAKAPKVKLDLKVGEKQYLGDLLYSLMLESHNDTAVAIAEHIGGSVEAFCQMMTERAHEMGALQTSFETPNGLDGENHYTTAKDLALITAEALKNEKLLEIINTPNKNIPSQPLEGSKNHSLQNKNRFLSSYQGANGVKTGYTNKAGHCFVGAANQNNMQLIAVALGAGWGDNGKSRKFTDVSKMMNYGFKNYKKYKVVKMDEPLKKLPVIEGTSEELILKVAEEIVLPLTEEELENIKLQLTLPPHIEAPISSGEKIGSLRVVCQDEVLESIDVLSGESIERATLFFKVKQFFEKFKK